MRFSSPRFTGRFYPSSPCTERRGRENPSSKKTGHEVDVFVVKLLGDGPARYLRTTLSLGVTSEHDKEEVKKFNGVIRHAVIMYLTERRVEELNTPEGKTRIRADSTTRSMPLWVRKWSPTYFQGISGVNKVFDRFMGCHLVLVDTAGVNPRDRDGMKAFAKLLHGFPDLRRALLMGAATNRAEITDHLARYRKDGLQALIFTKLDECRYFGVALSTALSCGVPLSYITSGQNLVGDFEIAEPATLVSLIFPGVESHE